MLLSHNCHGKEKFQHMLRLALVKHILIRQLKSSIIVVYYFEALDLFVNCIRQRFDQPGYGTYQHLRSLLLNLETLSHHFENKASVTFNALLFSHT